MLVKMEPFWQLNKEKEDSELPESTLSRSQVFWARPSPRFPRGESSGMRNPCWHLTLCPQEYNCAARDMILHCWHSLQHKHNPWPWPSNSLQLSVVRQREAHGKKNSETTPFKPLTFTDIHWPCEITSHSTEHHQPVLWLLEPGRWANTYTYIYIYIFLSDRMPDKMTNKNPDKKSDQVFCQKAYQMICQIEYQNVWPIEC